MRHKLFMVLTALVATGAFTGTAAAQYRPWEISIAGGPSIPRGQLGEEAGTGYHVQGSVGFGVPMLPFSVRADALWQEFEDTEGEWFRQIGGIANAVVGIPLVIVEPYALAGVSYLRTETPDATHAGHTHTGDSENLVGFNAGAGVEFPLAGLSGFLEARALNILGGGDAKNFQSFPITFGIRF